MQTLKARCHWKVYSGPEIKRLSIETSMSSKIIIPNWKGNENLLQQTKLKKFMTTKTTLHKIWEGLLHTEE
jgi:hypothetical protein